MLPIWTAFANEWQCWFTIYLCVGGVSNQLCGCIKNGYCDNFTCNLKVWTCIIWYSFIRIILTFKTYFADYDNNIFKISLQLTRMWIVIHNYRRFCFVECKVLRYVNDPLYGVYNLMMTIKWFKLKIKKLNCRVSLSFL